MRFNVTHLDTVCGTKRLECAQLVSHEGKEIGRRHRHFATSKILPIVKARVSADGNSVLMRSANGTQDDIGVPA